MLLIDVSRWISKEATEKLWKGNKPKKLRLCLMVHPHCTKLLDERNIY